MPKAALTEDSPAWLEFGLSELARIENPERNKKINTLIAIVDARLAGESDASVFRRAGTVSRNIWYEKWSHDPVIVNVLANLESIARPLHDAQAIRAMAAAATKIQIVSPRAAQTAIDKLASLDEAIALRAAFGLLDRAGVETAAKSSAAMDSEIVIKYADAGDNTS